MTCKRGGNFPSVVVFVKVFVQPFVVESSVDPVDEAIREHDESY